MITSTAKGLDALKFEAFESFPLANQTADSLLDRFRFEHVIFASADLSILTAWAQAEYAVMALKMETLEHHAEWLERMNSLGVVRQVPR